MILQSKICVLYIEIIPSGAVLGEAKQWGTTKRSYSYEDILRITNNFERTLGVGGFGKVYYGKIDATEVAVKMLSPQSVQGYDQFEAEVCTFLDHTFESVYVSGFLFEIQKVRNKKHEMKTGQMLAG